jgi:hypothetical protein
MVQVISPEDLSKLPWPIRIFFKSSRFYNPAVPGSYFLAFRPRDSSVYIKGRAYLDDKFSDTRDTSDISTKLATAMISGKNMKDPALTRLCVQAVWRQLVPEGHPEVPEDVLKAASKQVGFRSSNVVLFV